MTLSAAFSAFDASSDSGAVTMLARRGDFLVHCFDLIGTDWVMLSLRRGEQPTRIHFCFVVVPAGVSLEPRCLSDCPFLELGPLRVGAGVAFGLPSTEGGTTGPSGTSVLRTWPSAECANAANNVPMTYTRNHIDGTYRLTDREQRADRPEVRPF